jgi:hypothetical protein
MKAILTVTAVALTCVCAISAQIRRADVGDRWKPVQFLLGTWIGEVDGQPGHGSVQRSYAPALRGTFIEVRNKSTYPPQAKNPKGEVHEDRGFISYDRTRKKLMLRQFHVEGFVNQFVATAQSEDGKTLVFESEQIENIAPGWRAKETYRDLGNGRFQETFELAEPGKDYAVYSQSTFRRK